MIGMLGVSSMNTGALGKKLELCRSIAQSSSAPCRDAAPRVDLRLGAEQHLGELEARHLKAEDAKRHLLLHCGVEGDSGDASEVFASKGAGDDRMSQSPLQARVRLVNGVMPVATPVRMAGWRKRWSSFSKVSRTRGPIGAKSLTTRAERSVKMRSQGVQSLPTSSVLP